MIKLFLICGAVFGGGYAWHRYQRRREQEAQDGWDDEAARRQQYDACMQGVWSEPRQLIADIVQQLHGPAKTAAETATGRLVSVSLTPQAQRNAWASAIYLANEGATEARDAAIRLALQNNVAPRCDWSRGHEEYAVDPRFRDVYESVGQILDLAELAGKYGSTAAVANKGALVATGWVHRNPAPSAEVRPGDFVEVMVDRFCDDPTDDSRYAEWAWVLIDSVGEVLHGTVTFAAPPGAQANALRNTESHGVGVGTPVAIPPRCVHRVIHGR